MFEQLQQRFPFDGEPAGGLGWHDPHGDLGPEVAGLFASWGGASFGSGLYRVHSRETFETAARAVVAYLPADDEVAVPFGFDWLGRNFAIVPGPDRSPLVMVDLAEARVFEIPVDLGTFHDAELAGHPDDALAADWFREWRAAHGNAALRHSECVGYRTPLFLGGPDEDDNMEVSDVDVYWSVTSQLYDKVKDLPEGTRIDGISIGD